MTEPIGRADDVPPLAEEDGAFALTFLWYPWITPLIDRCKAAQRLGTAIGMDDLLTVPADETIDQVYAKTFVPAWEAEKASPKDPSKGPSLLTTFRNVFGTSLFVGCFLRFLCDGTTLCIPIVLRVQIQWVTDYAASPEDFKDRMWQGYLLAVLLAAMVVFSSVTGNASAFVTNKVFMRMRTCSLLSIYDKTTSLNGSHGIAGRITQMHGSDASKFLEVATYFQNISTAIPMLAGAVIIMYFFIGPAAFVSLGVSLLGIPIQLWMARAVVQYKIAVTKAGDRRLQRVNEFVQGIRIIKFMNWETQFEESVDTCRRAELRSLESMLYGRTGFSAFATFLATFLAVATFTSAYGMGSSVQGPEVFATLAMLSILRIPLAILSLAGSKMADLVVVMDRFQSFLMLPEPERRTRDVASDCPIDARPSAGIYVPFAKVLYDASASPVPPTPATPSGKVLNASSNVNDDGGLSTLLQVSDLELRRGELTIVIGATASGKSTLINAIVGEAHLSSSSVVYRRGTLAYVAQEAWIMNDTVRKNVLMDKPYDEQRYKRAVLACQLKADLEQLPGSDETEIGERGINLSGGQKQRLALARAVYADADVVLMDDPLSAVDPHVCAALFHGCVRGALAGKTRVLVTHQQQFLRWADRVIVLAGLDVVFNGTYDELLADTTLEKYDLVPQQAQPSSSATSPAEKVSTHDHGESEDLAACDFELLAASYTVPLSANAKAPKSKVLMTKEAVNTSSGFPIFLWYYREGGLRWLFLVMLAFATWRTSLAFFDYMLTWWATRTKPFNTYSMTQDQYCYWYAILAVISLFLVSIRIIPLVKGAVSANHAVHMAIIRRLLNSPVAFYDTTPAGRILSRVGKDTETMDVSTPELLNSLYNISSNLLAALIIQAVGAWFMPIVYVFIFAAFVFFFRGFLSANHDVRYLDSVLRSPVMAIMNETLGGLATLRAYNMTEPFKQRHAQRVAHMNRSSYCSRNLQRWLGVRTDALSALIVMAVGLIVLAMMQNMSGSDRLNFVAPVSLALTTVVQIPQLMTFLTSMFADLVASFSSVERLQEYAETLDQERTIEYWDRPDVEMDAAGVAAVRAPAPPAEWPHAGAIDFEHVFLRYRPGLDLVLKDVSFRVGAGEKVGVVGRTGSGKSTIMLSLFRIIEVAKDTHPVGNRIVIDGVDIAHVKLSDLRSKITIIPQDPLLFQGTVRSNLDPFHEHADDVVWRTLEKVHMRDRVLKEEGGLDCTVTERGQNMSAGERQLLCLARALLKNCKVLLLDEATASIDPHHDQLVQDTIRTEFRDRTVLTIAHRLGTVIDSDKVLVLDAGTVLEYGSPHELLQRRGGAFASMVHELGAEEEARLTQIAHDVSVRVASPY